MSHTQTTITAPVTTSDVAAVLAVASHNIGYLCRNLHGKINKWSKYKPVPLAQLFPVRTSDWWRGTDNRCGLKPVYTDDYRDIPGMYTEELKTEGWEYTPPKGGSIAPFRIADFNMYLHSARPPFYEFSCIEKACKGKLFYAGCAYNPVSASNAPTSLGLEDIEDDSGTFIQGATSRRATLKDYYFGIVICKPDGSILTKLSAEKTGDTQIRISNFNASVITGQTYTVYPFISLYRFVELEQDPYNNYIYPLPCVGPASFKVVTAEEYAGLDISVYGLYTIGKTGAKVTVKIFSAKACSFYASLYVRHTPDNTTTDMYDKVTYIGSSSSKETIAANGTFEKSYIFNLDELCYGQYHIHLILHIDSLRYEKTGALMYSEQTVNPF